MTAANMGSTPILTVPVNPSGVYVTQPVASSDGSLPISGANGTSVATPANAVPVAVDGINGSTVATGVNPVPVRMFGNAAIVTSQVTVATGTSAQIAAARVNRNQISITNLGVNAVYLGPSGVTVATGHLLPGVVGATVTFETTAAVFAIGAVAQAVSILETHT